MSSIVIAGDTSGSVTLQAPAIAGSTILTLPATSGTIQTSGGGYTTNGVAYASSTSVLTTGSALTFDGTKLAVLSSSAAVLESIKSTSSTSQSALFQVNNDADVPFNIGVFGSTAGTFGVLGASTPFISTNASTLNFVNTNASGAVVFGIGSSAAESMRLNSTGLGIGTSSPATKLAVAGGIAGTAGLNISGAGWGVLPYVANSLVIDNNGGEARLFATGADASTDGSFLFYTGQTDGGANLRATIDSSGNLLVGTTDSSLTTGVGYKFVASATIPAMGIVVNTASTGSTYHLYNTNATNNGYRFYVNMNGGISNYSANNTNLSDERTKTDIQDAGGYLAKICAISVRTFKYKDQTDDLLNLGCIAQEVEAVAPELVDVSGFGETPEDGVPLKAIYQTDLQYALMKCIQEQQALITQLQADVAALKGA